VTEQTADHAEIVASDESHWLLVRWTYPRFIEGKQTAHNRRFIGLAHLVVDSHVAC